MNTKDYVDIKGKIWALSNGYNLIGSEIEKGERNYLEKLSYNLFTVLSEESEKEIRNGDGKEFNQNENKSKFDKKSHSDNKNDFKQFNCSQ